MPLSLAAPSHFPGRVATDRRQPRLPLERPAGGPPGWPLRRQLTMVTAAWMFGAIYFNVTQGATLTLFAKGLGASPMQFGLLAAIPYVAALFSVVGSLLVERTGDRKRIFLDAHYVQRALWLAIAAAPVLMIHWYGQGAAARAVGLVLALVFVAHACGAVGGPAWVSWMADVVPHRIRGAYFARRRQWGIVAAVPAAILIGVGFDRLAGHDAAASPLAGVPPIVFWCAALFAVVTFFGLADIAGFQPLPHAPKPPQSGRKLLRAMADPLRNRPFLALSGFVGAINFTVGFTNAFATLYVIDRLKVDHLHAQAMLLVLPMVLQLIMLPAWGAAVDKMGKRPLLIIGALGLVPMGFGWCLMSQDLPWLGYLLYAGGATLWTGMEVANFNAVIDANGHRSHAGDRPASGGSGYHAVNTVIINVGGCAGGLTAGLIAQQLSGWTWQPLAGLRAVDSFDALFALSGTVRLAALAAFVPLLHEPTAKSVAQTARFMARFTLDRLTARWVKLADRWARPAEDGPTAVPATARAVEG